jgi:hypothetical protein
MQPYFFPYLGHFSLIAACDQWIVFDITQYTPKSWMNRNRILHPNQGCKWLTVPLANGSIHIRTEEARLLDPIAARDSVLGHLSHYRRAPHYAAVRELVAEAFTEDSSLVRLNARALQAVCRYIGLPFPHRICSEIDLPLRSGLGAGDWAREICAALGAKSYVNPIGGRALFDPASFTARGIELDFLQADTFTYDTGRFGFEPNLSVLDALMWNRPETVRAAVERYRLVPAT